MANPWTDETVYTPNHMLYGHVCVMLMMRDVYAPKILRAFTVRVKLKPMPHNIDKDQLAKDMELFEEQFPVLGRIRCYAEACRFRMSFVYEHWETDWSRKPPFREHQYRWTSISFFNDAPPRA